MPILTMILLIGAALCAILALMNLPSGRQHVLLAVGLLLLVLVVFIGGYGSRLGFIKYPITYRPLISAEYLSRF